MTVSSPQQRRRLGESLYTRALGLASDGHLGEAEHHFEEALNLCPQDARIWYHRGHLHEQMGKLESSIHCYNKARSADRSNPMYERAWREAVRMLDQLPAVPTDAGDGDALTGAGAPPAREAERETVPTPPLEVPKEPHEPPQEVADPPRDEPKAVVDVPLDLPIFDSDGLESLSTQMFEEEQDEEVTVHRAPEKEKEKATATVRTVERIGGTWVLWHSSREDDHEELDTLRTSSDQLFSNSSAATLVVPLDELEDEDSSPPSTGRGSRDTASFVNRRNARILDSGQFSVIGMACLRLIAEGDAEQVVEMMHNKKYPDLKTGEAQFLLATAYITLAEKTLLDARDLEGGIAEHLETLKLWFEQR